MLPADQITYTTREWRAVTGGFSGSASGSFFFLLNFLIDIDMKEPKDQPFGDEVCLAGRKPVASKPGLFPGQLTL